MTAMPPEGSPNLETVEECLAFQEYANGLLAALFEGYSQVQGFCQGLESTYDSVLGTGSMKAGLANTAGWVALEGAKITLSLSEMNDNLLRRLQALQG
jgi:hypothetical protein